MQTHYFLQLITLWVVKNIGHIMGLYGLTGHNLISFVYLIIKFNQPSGWFFITSTYVYEEDPHNTF